MPTNAVRRRAAVALFAAPALAAAALTSAVPSARGGLISDVAVHEEVSATHALGPIANGAYLDVTALPIHQVITATAGPVGSQAAITSTYDVTDDGTTATYRMAAQGMLTTPGTLDAGSNTPIDGGYGPTVTHFVLSAPATFVASLVLTGPFTTADEAALYQIHGFQSTPVFGLGTAPVTGTLAAGVQYTIYDEFVMNNTVVGGPSGNGSGSYTFTLTLTAVPEPATAGVLAVAAAAGLLGRRQRHGIATCHTPLSGDRR